MGRHEAGVFPNQFTLRSTEHRGASNHRLTYYQIHSNGVWSTPYLVTIGSDSNKEFNQVRADRNQPTLAIDCRFPPTHPHPSLFARGVASVDT